MGEDAKKVFKQIFGDINDIHKDRPEKEKVIWDNWDKFLSIYYCQPCPGCRDGHPSHWKTVIESPQWQAWKATYPPYDFAENEELGIMSPQHFQDFLRFVINSAITGDSPKRINHRGL